MLVTYSPYLFFIAFLKKVRRRSVQAVYDLQNSEVTPITAKRYDSAFPFLQQHYT